MVPRSEWSCSMAHAVQSHTRRQSTQTHTTDRSNHGHSFKTRSETFTTGPRVHRYYSQSAKGLLTLSVHHLHRRCVLNDIDCFNGTHFPEVLTFEYVTQRVRPDSSRAHSSLSARPVTTDTDTLSPSSAHPPSPPPSPSPPAADAAAGDRAPDAVTGVVESESVGRTRGV